MLPKTDDGLEQPLADAAAVSMSLRSSTRRSLRSLILAKRPSSSAFLAHSCSLLLTSCCSLHTPNCSILASQPELCCDEPQSGHLRRMLCRIAQGHKIFQLAIKQILLAAGVHALTLQPELHATPLTMMQHISGIC